MTEILLVRHGETDWNVARRFQGHIDIPLNARGVEQARRLAQRLATEFPDLAAIHASDLDRAHATAAPTAAALGLPVQTARRWRERNYGIFEGLTVPEIEARHPEDCAAWRRMRGDHVLPGGESMRDTSARIVAGLRDLAREHAGQRILLTTHGGVLDVVWRAAHGLSLDGARVCPVPNCALNVLRIVGDDIQVLRWADDAHCADLEAA